MGISPKQLLDLAFQLDGSCILDDAGNANCEDLVPALYEAANEITDLRHQIEILKLKTQITILKAKLEG